MRLISADDLKAKGIPFGKTKLWRMTKDGQFPKAVSLGYKSRAWVESEVDEWIASRIRDRDHGAGRD